jgi:hypothetical protein
MLSQEIRSQLAERFSMTVGLLGSESDRGAAIVGAALVEVALDNALKKYLIPPSDQKGDFLDGRDFTFALKIDLAYRTGLIRPHIRKAFHQIRHIRNGFAHDPYHQGFGDAAIRDRVLDLCELTHDFIETLIETLRALNQGCIFSGAASGSSRALVQALGVRGAFDIVVAIHCAGLEYMYGDVEPIRPLA